MLERNKNNQDAQAPIAGSRSALGDIDCWIFDLDNTLYPASCRLFDQIEARMNEFIAAEFGVDLEEAKRRRSAYFRAHGTTLSGLMKLHDIEPHRFLEHVHRIDLSGVPLDPRLGPALAALPGRKLVFTNGSVRHAENVLGHLGLGEHFTGIFDIVACNYVPKPDPAGYAELVRRFGVVPDRAAMIEDIARNLAPAAALGMTTVWVRGTIEWAALGAAEADYIHHTIEALTPWLETLAPNAATGAVDVTRTSQPV